MLEGSESSVGFLRSSKVRNAENAIGQLEGLVTVLRLTQADIKPAEEALQVAKQLFAGGQYAKAFHAAKRAESLAIMLDERFGGYQQAATALRVRIQSMQRLGLRADLLEAILTRAEEKVLSGTWEEGMFVPNYVEARRLLERAEQEGRAFQHKAERASNGIFMAELAIESIGEIKGPTDPIAFVHGATPGLEGLLQDATKELALGNADGAAEVARDIVAKAAHLKKRYAETVKSLDGTEAQMAQLRGEGILTNGTEGEIRIARETLEKGLVEPAAAMAARLQRSRRSRTRTARRRSASPMRRSCTAGSSRKASSRTRRKSRSATRVGSSGRRTTHARSSTSSGPSMRLPAGRTPERRSQRRSN